MFGQCSIVAPARPGFLALIESFIMIWEEAGGAEIIIRVAVSKQNINNFLSLMTTFMIDYHSHLLEMRDIKKTTTKWKFKPGAYPDWSALRSKAAILKPTSISDNFCGT